MAKKIGDGQGDSSNIQVRQTEKILTLPASGRGEVISLSLHQFISATILRASFSEFCVSASSSPPQSLAYNSSEV
jgi:hypothetical protein